MDGPNQIPGPAGEASPVTFVARHAQDNYCLHRRAHEQHLTRGEVIEIVSVTRGIAGEVTLLLKRDGEQTARASLTRAAVQKLGPLRPGDMISIEMDVHPISSSHFNPMRLLCLGSDTCSRVGVSKDEKVTSLDKAPVTFVGEEPRIDTGLISGASVRQEKVSNRPETWDEEFQKPDPHRHLVGDRAAPVTHSLMPVPPQRQDDSRIDQDPSKHIESIQPLVRQNSFSFELEEEESTLCQDTQRTISKPDLETTLASINDGDRKSTIPAATSTWQTQTRPEASMNADLYGAFTDSEDENLRSGGNGDVRLLIHPHEQQPVIPRSPPRHRTRATSAHQSRAVSDRRRQVDEDSEEDDLLIGLDDPF